MIRQRAGQVEMAKLASLISSSVTPSISRATAVSTANRPERSLGRWGRVPTLEGFLAARPLPHPSAQMILKRIGPCVAEVPGAGEARSGASVSSCVQVLAQLRRSPASDFGEPSGWRVGKPNDEVVQVFDEAEGPRGRRQCCDHRIARPPQHSSAQADNEGNNVEEPEEAVGRRDWPSSPRRLVRKRS